MAVTALIVMTMLASSGSCQGAFEQVVDATEENYAGYVVKLPDDGSRRVYRQFRDMMADQAAAATDPGTCKDVMDAYVGFFADHHLFVLSHGIEDSPLPQLKTRWSESAANRYVRRQGDALDPVEGFWRDSAGRLAVVHDSALAAGQFVAIRMDGDDAGAGLALIERTPSGYRIRYRHADWGWQALELTMRRSGDLLAFGTEGWARHGAANLDQEDPMAPLFKDMGEHVYYLSMPSFMPRHREKLLKIIADHGDQMANATGLILDVRGNAGGDAIYFPLAPYMLANDITVSDPSSVRASPRTIKHFEWQRKQQGEHGAWLDEPLENMRRQPGEIVAFREGSVSGLPEYPKKPDQVVILQDRGVGSAAEALIYHAGQSTKVVTMGHATRGNIDYMQVSMHQVGEGDYNYWYGYPLYFRSDLPATSVDDEGYAPDVALTLPEESWLPFAVKWVSERSDRAENP